MMVADTLYPTRESLSCFVKSMSKTFRFLMYKAGAGCEYILHLIFTFDRFFPNSSLVLLKFDGFKTWGSEVAVNQDWVTKAKRTP